MPKRTDLRKILIIGSGPIVIGQACEFDYSGTQGCKALARGGFEVVLVNSNPATIMTDPEMADAHLHRAAHAGVRGQDHRARAPGRAAADARRPDRARTWPWRCTRTARSTASAWSSSGPRSRRSSTAEDRKLVQAGHRSASAWPARVGHWRARWTRREAIVGRTGYPADHPALLHAGRHRRLDRLQPRGAGGRGALGPADVAGGQRARRGVGDRLEGVRAGGDARPRRQRRHHLLDRERRPDGRAHRRLDHGRPGPDADRQGIPADARRRRRHHPRDRRGDRRLQHPVRGQSRRRPAGRHRDEPAGQRAPPRWPPRPPGSPSPRSPPSWPSATRLDEIRNDITRETPACFEPVLDYCVVKIPRWAFEKFPRRTRRSPPR